MRRTQEWWAKIAPEERQFIRRYERNRAEHRREFQALWSWYVPPWACPLCGEAIEQAKSYVACAACVARYKSAVGWQWDD